MSIMRTSRGDYMYISMRSALGERTMLETPILVALVVLAIAAVAGGFTADGALELLRRTILTGSIL